jgi:hypothetical protein
MNGSSEVIRGLEVVVMSESIPISRNDPRFAVFKDVFSAINDHIANTETRELDREWCDEVGDRFVALSKRLDEYERSGEVRVQQLVGFREVVSALLTDLISYCGSDFEYASQGPYAVGDMLRDEVDALLATAIVQPVISTTTDINGAFSLQVTDVEGKVLFARHRAGSSRVFWGIPLGDPRIDLQDIRLHNATAFFID